MKEKLSAQATFQQKILDVMKKRREWTVHELVKEIFGEPKHYRSSEYTRTHRALRALLRKGLVSERKVETTWKLT